MIVAIFLFTLSRVKLFISPDFIDFINPTDFGAPLVEYWLSKSNFVRQSRCLINYLNIFVRY